MILSSVALLVNDVEVVLITTSHLNYLVPLRVFLTYKDNTKLLLKIAKSYVISDRILDLLNL